LEPTRRLVKDFKLITIEGTFWFFFSDELAPI